MSDDKKDGAGKKVGKRGKMLLDELYVKSIVDEDGTITDLGAAPSGKGDKSGSPALSISVDLTGTKIRLLKSVDNNA